VNKFSGFAVIAALVLTMGCGKKQQQEALFRHFIENVTMGTEVFQGLRGQNPAFDHTTHCLQWIEMRNSAGVKREERLEISREACPTNKLVNETSVSASLKIRQSGVTFTVYKSDENKPFGFISRDNNITFQILSLDALCGFADPSFNGRYNNCSVELDGTARIVGVKEK
jgi:hypothetical protein